MVSVAGATAILMSVATLPVAGAAPAFQLPFICEQTYVGTTYSGHGWAIDFNKENNADAGDPVVASAAGIVTSTYYATSKGEITITHSGGWQTKYAHMSGIAVTRDQSVARGKLLGYVDDIGDATREHLHYEQDYDGVRVQPRFDGARYQFGTAVSSTNCSDTTPPELTGPDLGFLTGTKIKRSGATVPVRDTWTVSDALSGVRRSVLQRATDAGAYVRVFKSSDPSSRSFTSYLPPSATSRLTDRVKAIDNAGNVSPYGTGPTVRVRAFEENAGAPDVTYTGTGWKTATDTARYSGGTVLRASAAGNTVTLTQEGHDFAIVATRGPDKGRFQVYVDGVAGSIVDLYSPTAAYRRIVWQASYPSPAQHTVTLQALGERSSASSATIVEVDAFLVLQP